MKYVYSAVFVIVSVACLVQSVAILVLQADNRWLANQNVNLYIQLFNALEECSPPTNNMPDDPESSPFHKI